MVGDLKHSRTAHSLVKLLSLLKNIRFNFISAEALRIPRELLEELLSRGHSAYESTDLVQGLRRADVLYMTRLQEERFATPQEAEQYRGAYCLKREIYEKGVGSRFVPILHPLPRDHRFGVCEIDQDLNEHAALAIFRQAQNGIPLRMALFALILDVATSLRAF